MKTWFKKFVILFLLFNVILYSSSWDIDKKVKAANISNAVVTASDYTPLKENVSYTVTFSLPTAQRLQKVVYYFGKNVTDKTAPANLGFTINSTISSSLSTWTVSSPSSEITLTTDEAEPNITEKAAETEISMTVTDVKNPELDDCSVVGEYRDVCFVHIETYSYIPAEGENPAQSNVLTDVGVGQYELTDTPYFTFYMDGVAANVTNNDITTSKASSYNSLSFGTLEYKVPRFMAQKLFVETNSPSGYDIKIRLLGGVLQGMYPANNIDPFIPNENGSWFTPQTWSHPTSTIANEGTGWFGANTTDTRVDGWIGAEGKFGPMASGWRSVSIQNSRNRGSKTVYVTYGLEINYDQPADSYAGTIEYLVLPKY